MHGIVEEIYPTDYLIGSFNDQNNRKDLIPVISLRCGEIGAEVVTALLTAYRFK